MKKKDLLALLEKLPDNTQIYVRVGSDDAWPATATAFEGENVVYLGPNTSGDHRNYPEGYSGVKRKKL